MFIRLDKTLKCDGRTDRMLWLIQRCALQAMRTRCKKTVLPAATIGLGILGVAVRIVLGLGL